ncbi:hypothetical protein DV736_g1762, partial [Chaetothyriales sp. CBS 134916]
MAYSYSSTSPQPYFPGFQHPQDHADTQLEDFQLNSNSDPFDTAFMSFQQNFHYDDSTFLAQHNNELPPHAHGPTSPKHTGHDSTVSMPEVDISKVQPGMKETPLDETGIALANRSSSEEKDTLTPQQSRRKAQNRAAQRAFRERKEKHVKDLEAKLNSLQHQAAWLNGENEKLRREIAKIATENKILRATSGSSSHNGATPLTTAPDELVGPLAYTPTDPVPGKKMSDKYMDSRHTHFISLKMLAIDDETGVPLLGTGETWDYIQGHKQVRKGLVDVGDVCVRLKRLARCDGQGPVFKECDIRDAIAERIVVREHVRALEHYAISVGAWEHAFAYGLYTNGWDFGIKFDP